MRIFILIAFLAVIEFANAGDKLSGQTELSEMSFNVITNPAKPVQFFGKVDINKKINGSSPILYPGGTPLIFLTAVLAHAAVQSGVENSQLSAEQKEANKILKNYESNIQSITQETLKSDFLNIGFDEPKEKATLFFDSNLNNNSKWSVNILPTCFITQDQTTLIFVNKVTFDDLSAKKPSKKSTIVKKTSSLHVNPNEKIIVLVSDPVLQDEPAKFWLSNEGVNFKVTIKKLYDESLQLSISYKMGLLKLSSTEQVTIRYLEEGVKKVERGTIFSQNCKRTIFESLLGEIKSVPNLDFSSCPTV